MNKEKEALVKIAESREKMMGIRKKMVELIHALDTMDSTMKGYEKHFKKEK